MKSKIKFNSIYKMNTKFGLVIAATVFAISCGGSKSKQEELASLKKQQSEIASKIKQLEKELGGDKKESKSILVKTEIIEPTTFLHYLKVQGYVDATENIVVNAKMPGTVSKIYVKEGATVKAGQLLAETDAGALLSGLEEAKTGLEFAKNIFEKQKKLWDQKIGTELQFLQAKNGKEQAEKRIATILEQIEMSKIISPISGVVDEVMLKLGQPASPGIPMNGIRIVNMGALKVKADVAETYSKSIKAGSNVIVDFPDAGKSLESKVSYVGKSINNLTRTFNVEVLLTGNNDFLQANMMALLNILDYKAENAITVPVNIVQNSEEGEYVMVAENSGGKIKAAKRMIKTGKNNSNRIEILEGLKQGDKVVTVGYQDLNNGDLINIIN